MGQKEKKRKGYVKMRIMGIDYGDARTGIAMSDLLCSIVGSTTVIHSKGREKTLTEIKRLVEGVLENMLLLDEIIVKEKWREYDPRISDPVKGAVYMQNLMDSPKKYIDLYLSIGKKAPQMYLDAVVALTYQLLYPYERYNGRFDYAEVSIDPKGFDQCYGAGRVQFNERFAAVRDWLERHIWESGADHVPVLRWIFNMGWIIWMMLFFVLREAWHGNWRRFVVFLLPVLLWGTFLLGPVVYSRYVYPFVCCLPVLASHKKDN